MPLTLTIRNADRLDNGSPLSLVLDRRGAIIGRAATADWSLPDPSLHISSRHCEIRFSDPGYELIDRSTNGTFLLGQPARLPGPHAIAPGDVFVIGRFEVAAFLDDAAASDALSRQAEPAPAAWKGWSAPGDSPAAPPASQSSWDAAPAVSAISGAGPLSQNWATPPGSGGWGTPPPAIESPVTPPASSAWGTPPPAEPAAPPASSGWGAPASASAPGGHSAWDPPAPPPAQPASDWSSPAAPPAPPSGSDIWGQFAQSNVVDWARGGFGAASAAPPPSFAAPAQHPPQPPGSFAPPPAVPPAAPSAPPAQPGPAAGTGNLAAALGLPPERLTQGEAESLSAAARLLRRLVAGMVVMLEARARAKSQLGAQSTSLEFDGNNPLKFARTPEQALEQLLNPPQRGFMDGERAVEDAFRDLQAHQMATLKAMQGALRTTLERFSPHAIRARAEDGGLLSRILPGARDAALWAAYEREFSGVAQGSDEAFMDMFAKEFRKAYDEASRQR
ncbi:MAG TPA: type VI secretion system-associated FHA domain protein TagH [Novosphingobium sp.]|nr:type VI secretion system-associated FHA domain protein TagH [Novosphingobium sp.]